MAQIVASLLFLLIAAGGIAVIAASLRDDWASLARALGFGGVERARLPQVRSAGSRQTRVVRFSRRSDDRRAAA